MKRSVVAIIFIPDRNEFLAIKRRDVPIWVLPGGGIEEAETPEDAAIREVLEETGLHVKIKRKIAEYHPINRLAFLTYFYECEVVEGSLQTGAETQAIGFYPLSKPPSPFFHIHLDMLKDAGNPKKQSEIKYFHQVTYWNLAKYFIQHPLLTCRFFCSRLGLPINRK